MDGLFITMVFGVAPWCTVQTADGQNVRMDELKPGTQVLSENGQYVTIKAINSFPSISGLTMYVSDNLVYTPNMNIKKQYEKFFPECTAVYSISTENENMFIMIENVPCNMQISS